ncbi:MAG: DUF507 family protein [Polyangiales bacterium]
MLRLFPAKITPLAEDLMRTLAEEGGVEFEDREEARLDLEAVLKEYVRLDRDVLDEAKSRLEIRSLNYSQLGKMKAQVAKERGAPPLDEVLPYLLNQILHMLFHSRNVAEIYLEDRALRLRLTPVLRRHMQQGEDVDREVRAHIKNLQEGTAQFEIEYARMLEQVKRRRGLKD